MTQKEVFEKYKKYVCPICKNKGKDCCDIRITTNGDAQCCSYKRVERNK